jgi:hypothetical protein
LEERRGGKKGLTMLKKRGEDKERVKNLEERKKKNKELKMWKKLQKKLYRQ